MSFQPPSTADFATGYGYKKWTTDLGEALADPEVDVVIIAGPSETHADMALASLEAGKHTPDLETLVRLARRLGLDLTVRVTPRGATLEASDAVTNR